MVCPPIRATISCTENPFFVKRVITSDIVMFGNGNWFSELDILDSRESFRPNWTPRVGPPEFVTSSLAAAARMSAQETTLGHSSSRTFLTRKTASKPSPERGRLTAWSRSALL
ncbi:hypothetical protein V8G54_001348 [Vigna mungo]|uniref:Uncharacterized protein n=1 Tax=Vigna mungo TaxID=3915 RepID=A0AAQ3SBQ3_VIGMU